MTQKYNKEDVKTCKTFLQTAVQTNQIDEEAYQNIIGVLKTSLSSKNQPEFLTIEDARKLLKVSRPSIYKLFNTGQLKKISILGCTRISLQDVLTLLGGE